jgi:TRAP-type C4-dicarboxylate transport system permease small subunit
MAEETAVSVPEIRMAWIYSVMPISGGLMVLVCIVELIKLLFGSGVEEGARPKAMEEGQ